MPLNEKETFYIVADIALLGLTVYSHCSFLGLWPPLIIDEDIADKIVEIFDKALDTSISANISRKARLVKEFAISKLKRGPQKQAKKTLSKD